MSTFAYPPSAPNACPECGHTPFSSTTCFSWDIKCLDWRGNEVPCICVQGSHFPEYLGLRSEHTEP